ncbi:MAG: glutamate--tRNA ligase [Betaproteobacteria bacterium AqS2]|uniref:Glutamate--tRNA ligase n=1 Tax=Candidatus Amphirhobacter heronislandensis TaxID=1732024 RepID=A0A930UE59_9GAMM|nr:glutamate--tRNA ligase [Betaproteobacteria bacterium AqS2]
MAVCRFAPSPTGRLHLGGARTALFNWAWARHSGGTFLLRIEDTDRQRSLPEHEEAIIAALDWLGLERDGPAVRQSERAALYQAAAERLVEEGKAYRCYATAAELDELRTAQERQGLKPQYDRRWRGRTDWPATGEYCLRFATPTEGDCAISDLIRGEVSVANKEFDDPVILRADGSATYNFAAVVDDGEMGITDVIRGEDHLTNTLRQVHIHRALGQEIPRFAHLPLILGRRLDENGEPATLESGEPAYERLSKRNMAVDVDHYRQMGIIAPAMVNYLAQLGWTQPGQEVYTPAELAAAFELGKVNKSAARFDLERLQWINQQHLRALPPAEVAELAGIETSAEAIEIGMEKARTLTELREELSWLQPPEGLDATLQGQLGDDNREAFAALVQRLEKLEEFSQGAIKQAIKDCCKEHGLKFPRLGMPLRVALTGKTKSPDVALVASILESNICCERLRSVSKIGK